MHALTLNAGRFAETKPDDNSIIRARKTRIAVLFGSCAITLLAGYGFGGYVANLMTDNGSGIQVGRWIGLGGSMFLAQRIVHRSNIKNGTTQMFVTINTLRSYLGLSDIHTSYGPGNHVAYWWERRIPQNNISLEEATNTFEFAVQCVDGLLKGKGSFRIRPDINRPIPFLTGIASVADELTDIMIAAALEIFSKAKVIDATKLIPKLNQRLHDLLADGLSDFEERFGVVTGDVTVRELLPTEEVQKTISALTEAAAIKKGTALLLGMSMAAVRKGLEDKTLPEVRYEKARKDFMSISGNLENMKVDRQEYGIEFQGLDKETAEAIVTMANQFRGFNFGGANNQRKGK